MHIASTPKQLLRLGGKMLPEGTEETFFQLAIAQNFFRGICVSPYV